MNVRRAFLALLLAVLFGATASSVAHAQDARIVRYRELQQQVEALKRKRGSLLSDGYLATSQRVQQLDDQIVDIQKKQKALDIAPKRKPSHGPRTKPTPKPKG